MKPRNFMCTTALVLLFCSVAVTRAHAFGGDSVGSGGVIWSCTTPDSRLQAGLLTDLVEARIQFKLKVIAPTEKDPMEIYHKQRDWLTRTLPEFASTLATRFEYVENHLNFVDAELTSTSDYNNDIRPKATDCGGRKWERSNFANFLEEHQQILISQPYWQSDKIAAVDKAALLFHEAVYYWMRTYFGATNSDKSRHIVGLLFSDLPVDQLKTELSRILGSYPLQPDGNSICIMKNSLRNQIYVAFDKNTDDASLSVRLRCQEDADANWCETSSIACEDIQLGQHHRCISQNSTTKRIYVGSGRSLIEAQFNAHMSCYVGSQAVASSAQNCPDLPFLECN